MRDPKRIKRILELMEILWLRVPDWRLGQLISNAGSITKDRRLTETEIFYMEDDKWEEYLKTTISELEGG